MPLRAYALMKQRLEDRQWELKIRDLRFEIEGAKDE